MGEKTGSRCLKRSSEWSTSVILFVWDGNSESIGPRPLLVCVSSTYLTLKTYEPYDQIFRIPISTVCYTRGERFFSTSVRGLLKWLCTVSGKVVTSGGNGRRSDVFCSLNVLPSTFVTQHHLSFHSRERCFYRYKIRDLGHLYGRVYFFPWNVYTKRNSSNSTSSTLKSPPGLD